ncbi:DNA repair protein RecN [Synechococcus sp. MIT S1220]|uniref:DNA repair protein RecN n=1 Tax=Synechococcus sp. MIT S1220 TaxID=3082549 RepID=UPI0039B03994
MLIGLQLQNIALIDSLELNFDTGFTVLTGETGAGKSILLDALDALLGGAQGASGVRLLRNGCDRARIEASFVMNAGIQNWMEQAGLEAEDDDLLLTREWRRQDDRYSSRSRLNGVAVNRQQLVDLRPLLIDLTMQGQTLQLSRPGQQRRWLDRLGGEELFVELQAVRSCWRVWREAVTALQLHQEEVTRLEQQRQELQELLDSLELGGLDDPAEEQRLEQEQDRLVHGVRLQEGLMAVFGRLRDGAEQAPSLQEHFGAAIHELQSMALLDGSLQSLRDQALDLEAGVDDLLRSLDLYGSTLESDPERLDRIQERLADLKRLQRRHGLDLVGLIQRRDALRSQLGDGAANADLAALRRTESLARQARDQANDRLHDLRHRAGDCLESSLTKLLRPMGLDNVRFQVQLTPIDPSEQGGDQVSFLFSANPGQPLAPLADVASGGEMSRFLLALKSTLASVDGSSTLLFDEIDAGVSGRVSGAMGALLHSLARHRQVFCVTHQPLVAAAADHHYRVSKTVSNGVTHSQVSHLRDTRQRQQELAELAGGEQAQAYAASLLEQKSS